MKKIFGMFFIGFVLGSLWSVIYFAGKENEREEKAFGLIDFVIEAWTTNDYADTADKSADVKAQFLASVEIPNSKIGFFPDTVKNLASIIEKKYSIPAAVTLAQWALESAWGKNNLGVSNYFGHTFAATGNFSQLKKSVSRTERMLNKRTLKFTVYENIAECFDVHGQYLSQSKLYRAAFFTNGAENFARAIALYYAEDPQYATKLITIIRRYNLE